MVQAQAGEGKTLSPPRCRVAHAWLHEATYALLDRAAQRRRIHVDQLVAAIVEQAVLAAEMPSDAG